MLKKIGRLDSETKTELNEHIDEIFALFDANKDEKAKKKLLDLCKTPNYFIREYVGKSLATYENQKKIEPLSKEMINHRIYGVRATALFYYYEIYKEDFENLFSIVENVYDVIPWEVESIVNDLWKTYPDEMKEKMNIWIESNDSKKRALSFHGMENIASSDPDLIMRFISKVIDDETLEVQKKISHILTQTARANPIIAFPYIREWLAPGDDKTIKTLWISMKKIANIVLQKNRRSQSDELVLLTEQTVNDWKNDENEYVAKMGEMLSRIINR